MRKNPHGWILKGEPKEQHLSTIPKSCFDIYTFCGSTYVKVRAVQNPPSSTKPPETAQLKLGHGQTQVTGARTQDHRFKLRVGCLRNRQTRPSDELFFPRQKSQTWPKTGKSKPLSPSDFGQIHQDLGPIFIDIGKYWLDLVRSDKIWQDPAIFQPKSGQILLHFGELETDRYGPEIDTTRTDRPETQTRSIAG